MLVRATPRRYSLGKMSEKMRVDPGMLLAAWPDMLDPNFMHSVLLVCQHTSEGAYGFVLNRPANRVIGELVSTHPLLSRSPFPVYVGGPVESDTMQFVHSVPEEIPGGVSLDGKLWLGGEVDAMASFLDANPEAARSQLKVFLGYAGWGALQLEIELTSGSWLPGPADPEALFGEGGEEAWRRVVRSIGKEGWNLEQEPPDISWN